MRKVEGLRMKDKGCGSQVYGAVFRPYSSFILYPSSFRSGISLLEVLVSLFVLSLGLMGMASLLPVGRFAIVETGKSDRAGACGRAALQTTKVCRMLDMVNWSVTAGTNGGSFAVDPLDVPTGSTQGNNFGGASGIPRITLKSANASQLFAWPDDITFTKPEDMSPPPANAGKRALGVINSATGQLATDGNYSWFFTVTPVATEVPEAISIANWYANSPGSCSPWYACELHYTVSIVVCYRRDFSTNGEITATAYFTGGGLSGGDVLLSTPLELKEGNWVALIGNFNVPLSGQPNNVAPICRWYRVVSVGDDNMHVSLNGPDCLDWNNAGIHPTLVSLESGPARVVGVYTKTITVDKDALW